MIIAFTGPSCSGKTTLIDKVVWEAYLNSKPYKIINSHTRDLKNKGYGINDKGRDNTQIEIIDRHHINYLNYKCNKNKNYITDRYILDGLVYTEWLYNKQLVSENILNYAKSVFDSIKYSYTVVFYCLPVEYKDDEDRKLNPEDHKQICVLYDQYTKGLGNVFRLDGTLEKRLTQIDEILK